jgi:hypothetical protein
VEVVVDKSQVTARYSSAIFLANVGIPMRVDHRYGPLAAPTRFAGLLFGSASSFEAGPDRQGSINRGSNRAAVGWRKEMKGKEISALDRRSGGGNTAGAGKACIQEPSLFSMPGGTNANDADRDL